MKRIYWFCVFVLEGHRFLWDLWKEVRLTRKMKWEDRQTYLDIRIKMMGSEMERRIKERE